MTNLSLYLLGPARVKLDEVIIEVKPRKALALLIYLVVTAERHPRDFLATLLWPHSDQRKARHSLRSRLSELNLILGNEWLEADRESVGLRAGFWLDVTEFQRIVADKAGDPESLMAAADLYRDDFLTGFTLADCLQFDEWQLFQSESLRQSLASALQRLVRILSGGADYETAVPYARRWLAIDFLHEPAHQQLMQLHAQMGQQAAALRQYDQCRQTLEDELGISPSLETRTLYQDIQAGKVTGRERKPSPRHNLPVQTTTFVGRESEISDIKRLLLEEPGCRLLNLVGPGGIGKTRLALATAGQIFDTFPDGTFFVSLAPVSEVEYIVPTFAETLRFTFYGSTDPKGQLLNYLSQKELLLIVDNFEHLLDGATLLADILSQAPAVTLLATSRERLSLREEWVYEVQGLVFPIGSGQSSDVSKTSEVLSSYSAVQLFNQRVRQIVTNFTPSAAETADIVRICQLVDGMPLGLELAAPWMWSMTCREIVHEIKRNLDFLTSSLRNIPERHRSLRAVFEQTWERLSAAEQRVLQKLSVFRGGCTREAAQEVTNGTLPVLSSLVDKAFVRRTNTGRFEMHELIRQFAEAKLAESGDEITTKQKHLDAMANFAQEGEQILYGSAQQVEWLKRLENEHANMRAAIEWGLNHDQSGAAALATANWLYYYRCGYFREAQKVYDALLEGGDQLPDDLLATVLNTRCSVALAQGDLEGLESFATQALDRFKRLEDSFGTGLAYFHLAHISNHRGDFDRTRRLVDLGVDLAGNNYWLKSILLQPIFGMYETKGDLDRAAQTLLGMLANSERINDAFSALYWRLSLAKIEIKRKDLTQANDLVLRVQANNERYKDIQITAWVQEILGLVALASGEAEQAVIRMQRVVEIEDKMGSGQDRAKTLLVLGIGQTELHHFRKAKKALLLGSELALEERRMPVTLALLEHLSRLEWRERQDPACLRNLSATARERTERQMPLDYPFDFFINQTVEQIRQAIGAQKFEALWQDGRDLDPVLLLQEMLEQGQQY